MAIFGFHIVLTLIAASILQKLSARYSFGRKLLSSGLIRYLHPTTEDLKVAAGHGTAGTNKGLRKRHRNDHKADNVDSEGFPVPKNAEFPMEKASITSIDVLQLPFYVEFRWLIDFTLATMVVYVMSEIYMWLITGVATSEVNLSIVWCSILVILCLRSLASLSALYFRSSEDTGERSLVLCFGAIFFLIIMSFFLVAERFVDLELSSAYQNFTATANDFMKSQELDYRRSESSSVFLFLFFSLLFGFLSGMLVFPSFRYSKMYTDGLRYAQGSPFEKLLLHASFFSPLAALLLWVRPVTNQLLERQPQPLLTLAQLESLRFWSLIIITLLRVCTARLHLQAYLNLAHDKVMDMKNESGRINSLELQRMIGRIFMYFVVAAVQYFTPVLLVFALTMITKTLGSYSWLTPFGFPKISLPFLSPASFHPKVFEKTDMRASLTSIYSLFNPIVNRGICGSILITTVAVSFSLNIIGVLYNTRFVK